MPRTLVCFEFAIVGISVLRLLVQREGCNQITNFPSVTVLSVFSTLLTVSVAPPVLPRGELQMPGGSGIGQPPTLGQWTTTRRCWTGATSSTTSSPSSQRSWGEGTSARPGSERSPASPLQPRGRSSRLQVESRCWRRARTPFLGSRDCACCWRFLCFLRAKSDAGSAATSGCNCFHPAFWP